MQTFIIQNQDRVIRAKDYANLAESGDLLVTSIFRTLQGEAPFAGWPAVFLRMAGCNFGDKSPDSACRFCDTSFQFDQGKRYNAEDLRQELYGLAKDGDILVITGGEPTLQKNLAPFIKEVLDGGFGTVQIETNGTQAAWFKEADNWDIHYAYEVDHSGLFIVTSPKGIYKAGTIPKPSDVALQHTGALKFVIEADPTSAHHRVPDWVKDLPNKTPIYVSPMAAYLKPYQGEVSSIWDRDLIDHEKTSQNYAYAAQYAIEKGYRLSVQSHLFTAIP